MITDPKERFDRIGNLIESLTKTKFLGDWQLQVNC